MKRRITIPEEHIALILPNRLADELMSLMTLVRKNRKFDLEKQVAGDVMLALLEAKEAQPWSAR